MNKQLTRMERNRQLHERVNRDIIIEKESQFERSNIAAVFKTLDAIDKNYFKNKVNEFDKKNTIEKPYLDKDKSKSLIKDELKYDLRRFYNELLSSEELMRPLSNKKDDISSKMEDNKSINLTSQKFIDYYQKIAVNEQNFQNQVQELRRKSDKKTDVHSDINFATVTKVRNADNRTTPAMLKEVSDKNERGYNLLMKETKMYKHRFGWIVYLLPVLILLMILAIVLPLVI
ncbi:hypothetical protein [Spiroplasma alleghenense]|uniref:Uncharacterized protein n=1 Tax=Spiroplasma alleghenense TaxID=216931 RepID=A0A345Z492_9MOLU|nr:hypothetical protein [Spiroplasma alleghenense]AXK51421.1 hypothetical protein SALLE_v1c07510 [Spiroplasma alleghenense]